jgi:DNA-binding LytR/AlgR family response regulator
MLEKMPAGKFVRIHRSFSVNLDKITEVGGGKVYIEQTSFPIGKLYKHALDGKF